MFKLLLTADQRALTSIIELYGARLRRYIMKWIPDASWADEIMQDVFLQLWRDRKAVARLACPEKWLFKVAYYKSIDYLRREKKHKLSSLSDDIQTSENESEVGAKNANLRHLLVQALEGLSEHQRQALLHVAAGNASLEQVASHMNISVYTLKTHLARARQKVRKYLKQHWAALASLILLYL
ncbi:MAG TPA: RNA polymerase sigma factor [Niabella sp.]|nr:RNA polymerase sigma factor [Niabella sp.]